MDVSDIALIAPIEGNNNNLNNKTIFKNFGYERLFEYEAIRCFTYWRKYAGWLKDINIYTVCLTGNDISEKTKEELKKLNVIHTNCFYPETKDFSSGFLNIPLAGRHFETPGVIKENILIKIDLDQYIVRPFPKELIEKANETNIVGQYSLDFPQRARWSYENQCPFDTSLIITNKKNQFYHLYYSMLSDKRVLESEEWYKVELQNGQYYLEEFAIDFMYHNGIGNITPIQKYQFGMGYPSLDTFTDEEIKKIYLCHEHIFIKNEYPYDYKHDLIFANYLGRLKSC